LFSPTSRLIVRLETNSFQMAPTAAQAVTDFRGRIKNVLAKFPEDFPPKEGKKAFEQTMLERRINNEIDFFKLPYDVTHGLKGVWFGKVENVGKKKCADVNLHLPGAVVATTQHDNESSPNVIQIKDRVPIGDLRAKAHCFVAAWTDARIGNDDIRSVILSHESGVGKVKAQYRVGRWPFLFSKMPDIALIFVFVLVIFGAITIFVSSVQSIVNKTAAHPSPTATPTATPPP
ncbi:MAG TPA: hypothetical protein VGM62_04760, partial [Chthoniobacterales bacterium]